MSNKYLTEEHEVIKKLISDETIRKIEDFPDPFTAADYLITIALVPNICAIIDKMSPLGGAFVFSAIKARAMSHPGELDTHSKEKYRDIVQRAEDLELNAVQGFMYARNETLRLTGVMAML